MFFNPKSVALADDANLKNFWSIGFELRSHLESWPCTIHHEKTLSRPHVACHVTLRNKHETRTATTPTKVKGDHEA